MKSYKNLLFAAMTTVVIAACSNDEIADAPPVVTPPAQEVPILFGSVGQGITRADYTGADAAQRLGNKFVVYGYKGSSTKSPGSTVFDNYLVEYTENTANTTASNTSNWEYAGKGRIKHAIDNGITKQTVKYWDYLQSQYDFIAWSTGAATAVYEGTPADGQVLVSAITPATRATQAFTFKGKADDLKGCYIADLLTVKKSGTTSQNVAVGYSNTVTLKFRQLGTKVRIGLYETIPGYSVKDVSFYSAAASDDAAAGAAKLFTTTANDIYTAGTYTISYPTVDSPASADNNQAHVSFAGDGTQTTVIQWGALNYTIAEEGEKKGTEFLGRSSSTASFAGDPADNYYVVYLPNETGTNLNLRVNYKLESIDGSGEEISVKGATAQIPLVYTQWKPGYAYTYLFKISDKTNGHTGVYDPTKPDDITVNSDPAGLYPITFDAVVVNDEEDATQETITLVSTPSITTYQKGSSVVDNNEYLAATGDIFVTVSDGNTAGTPDLAHGALQTLTGKAALYTIPDGYTEADVIDALSIKDDTDEGANIRGRSGLLLTVATSTLTDKVEYGADGNAINLATDQALRFTPAASKTYAFVYTKTAAASTESCYEPVAFTATIRGDLYRYGYAATTATYTDDNGTPTDDTDDTNYYDAQKGIYYYSLAGGVYTPQTPFLGQTVSNMYLDAAGSTIAKGYAVSSATYYYTPDHGMTYKAAHNVAYADFAAAELYTEASGVYTAKTDAAPVSGTAYYYKEADGSYTYCVILPEQTDGWYVVDTNSYVVATEAAAVSGQTYFDRYNKNDGVYYTKIIKVQ